VRELIASTFTASSRRRGAGLAGYWARFPATRPAVATASTGPYRDDFTLDPIGPHLRGPLVVFWRAATVQYHACPNLKDTRFSSIWFRGNGRRLHGPSDAASPASLPSDDSPGLRHGSEAVSRFSARAAAQSCHSTSSRSSIIEDPDGHPPLLRDGIMWRRHAREPTQRHAVVSLRRPRW